MLRIAAHRELHTVRLLTGLALAILVGLAGSGCGSEAGIHHAEVRR